MSHTTTDVAIQRTGTANLTESERHRLLADERRRLTLDVLAERTASVELAEQAAPVELADLAGEVATREDGTDEVDEETRERVMVSLHHSHLPLMDDLGVVDYDSTSHRITL